MEDATVHDIVRACILLSSLVPPAHDAVGDKQHDCGVEDELGLPLLARLGDEEVEEPTRGSPVPEVVLFLNVRGSEHENAVENERESVGYSRRFDGPKRWKGEGSHEYGDDCKSSAYYKTWDVVIGSCAGHLLLCCVHKLSQASAGNRFMTMLQTYPVELIYP